MKSSTLLVILVLQAALVVGVFAAVAEQNAAAPEGSGLPPPGKFRCCDNCDDLFSGLITCKDVHRSCHRACDNCTVVSTYPVKMYTCSDRYFGSCGYPCKKN